MRIPIFLRLGAPRLARTGWNGSAGSEWRARAQTRSLPQAPSVLPDQDLMRWLRATFYLTYLDALSHDGHQRLTGIPIRTGTIESPKATLT